MQKDIIIAIDIGGTTFESAILNRESLDILDMSSILHIRDYNSSELLFEAICTQIQDLLDKNLLKSDKILGLSIASPGPLDIKN